jgi:hypothetical protein
MATKVRGGREAQERRGASYAMTSHKCERAVQRVTVLWWHAQPRLQSLYYSFIQTGSTNGANVPESLKDAKHDLKLLASQQAAINRECKHSSQLSLADIPRSSVRQGLGACVGGRTGLRRCSSVCACVYARVRRTDAELVPLLTLLSGAYHCRHGRAVLRRDFILGLSSILILSCLARTNVRAPIFFHALHSRSNTSTRMVRFPEVSKRARMCYDAAQKGGAAFQHSFAHASVQTHI